MTLGDLMALEIELTEMHEDAHYMVEFKEDLSEAKFKQIKAILEELTDRGFGQFMIVGPKVAVSVVGDALS